MKYASVLLALGCLVMAAQAQWLETTISLPSWSHPNALCFNPSNNKIYAANRGNATVTVVDGEINEIVATVAVGASPYDLCYSSQDNLVYCASSTTSSVWVIDGQGDSVVTTLTVGSGPRVLCYNPINNKVYCANWYGNSVSIIHSGSVTNLSVAAHPFDLCYNEHYNKVYCSSIDGIALTVIDGASDSIVAVIPENYWPSYLVYNTKDDKLYCSHEGDYVEIVDGSTNRVLDTVGGWSGARYPCYNPQNDKVYYSGLVEWQGGHVMVIDGQGDSAVADLPVGAGRLCYNPQSNKVFCALGNSSLVVIGGATNSVIKIIGIGAAASDLVHAPPYNRVYVACDCESASISVLRDSISQGIQERPQPAVASNFSPSLIGDVLTMPQRSGAGTTAAPSVLLDISGRQVMSLRSGANDVSRLSPGVYFIITSCERSAATGPKGRRRTLAGAAQDGAGGEVEEVEAGEDCGHAAGEAD